MLHFIFEVRKKQGKNFHQRACITLLVACIQRYTNGNTSVDILAKVRVCLDAEMKKLQSLGCGFKARKAEPLTEEEEEILWQKGLLGRSTPQALVDNTLVMNGQHFALRSGKEHRQLRADHYKITAHERPSMHPYLKYVEDISKNRSGGLKGRKIQPKIVQHHNNRSNPTRLFVELFKLYQSLCPLDRPKGAFYLQPLDKPTPTHVGIHANQ